MTGYRLSAALMIGFVLLMLCGGNAIPAAADFPLVDGKQTLATINGEPLTLEEFDRALAGIHGSKEDHGTRSRYKTSELLERLINVRLILQEAHRIGLDELAEVRIAEKIYEEDTLREMLYDYHVQNIRHPDKKEVEKRYRKAVKEVKVTSVLMETEEDGKRLEKEVKAGGDFHALAQQMISAGKATGNTQGEYLKFESLNPEVARVVSSMRQGEISPLIPIGNQFTMFKLEEIRFPKDPAARERAEKDALQVKKASALKGYTESLRKKYVTIDRKLLDSIDYEAADPGFQSLLTDKRVLANVKGEEPVTVGDLTKALEKKFFHGPERAAQEKKINRKKDQVLENIVNRRVTLKEARVQKLDKTEFYRRNMKEFRDGLLFGVFVQKVIAPDVKVEEEEIKAYYQENVMEYTYPEMMRIDSLVFTASKDAENTIEKLRNGADFHWLRANADGQVDPSQGKNLLDFGGQLLDTRTLPAGVGKAISGAASGDYRLFADSGNAYYVLHIQERIPSRPIPLESVRGKIEKKVYAEKLQSLLQDWEKKLRKASDVRIYAAGADLDRLFNPIPR